MVGRNISIELSLWEQAKRKAGPTRSLSAIIRELLRLWISGEIKINDE